MAKEHDLYRVFDSLEFEDEENHATTTGFKTDGEIDEAQSKDIVPLNSSVTIRYVRFVFYKYIYIYTKKLEVYVVMKILMVAMWAHDHDDEYGARW